jgi:hypothetical protein
MTNPYLQLTTEFNDGRLRALISSGQAVVVYRLAVMSKDGDWILREDGEAMDHVLRVLDRHGARYRFGAPLDTRWLSGGCSAHLEYESNCLRIRTDFVTRPPRVSPEDLSRLWTNAAAGGSSVVELEPLAALKMTRREKDYPVIGELARRMDDPRSQLLYSRSSRDLLRLADAHPSLVREMEPDRPLLAQVSKGRDALDEALDRERRALMRADEERLAGYSAAAEAWLSGWREISRSTEGLPLKEAHEVMTSRAERLLPFFPGASQP